MKEWKNREKERGGGGGVGRPGGIGGIQTKNEEIDG